MTNPILYRRRIIPDELVLLKDDVIVSCTDELIVTKWKTLKARKDFDHGSSAYFLKEGYKVSKFYKSDNSLCYWYCDIIESDYDEASGSLVVTDLLADVIIYPDGFVKVVDIKELVDAFNDNKLSINQLKDALTKLDKILSIIYNGDFDAIKNKLDRI